MKKDYRNKGFTLVEMIVVIVIIGILLAILVPGMFKYIQKAKEQQAIVECRAVVTAADTLALELYAKDLFDELIFFSNYQADILEKAEVNGSIKSLSFQKDKPSLENLTYMTKSNIKVLYDIKQASVYQIVSEGSFSSNASGYHDFSSDALVNPSIDSIKDIRKKNKALQKQFYEKYGNATLSDSEKELFNSINGKITWDNYHWNPLYTKDGKLIVVANNYPYNSSQSHYPGTSIIFYEDNYYYFYQSEIHPIGSSYVSIAFNTDQLKNAPIVPPKGATSSTNVNTWIKIENP